MTASLMVDAEPIGAPKPLSGFGGLRAALGRLDATLALAMEKAREIYGSSAANDRFRGLYITDADADTLLRRPPGKPLFASDHLAPGASPSLPFATPSNAASASTDSVTLDWLRTTFDLSRFDLDVVLLALAPEIDLRYERLYAYLHDDVSRRRPSVDLACHLFCHSDEARIAARARLAPDAPLLRHRLIELSADSATTTRPLLAHTIKLDDQIVTRLLGHVVLDRRLAGYVNRFAAWYALEEAPLAKDVLAGLRSATLRSMETNQPIRLYFHGPHGSGKLGTAAALASLAGVPLSVLGLDRVVSHGADAERIVELALRDAWFGGAMLCLRGFETLDGDNRTLARARINDMVVHTPVVTIVASTRPWAPDGTVFADALPVAFGVLDAGQRAAVWRRDLARAGLAADPETIEAVAARFRLTSGGIDGAVATAGSRLTRRTALDDPPDRRRRGLVPADELFSAARAQCGADLATLAARVRPSRSWSELVLPPDPMAQLHELAARAAHGPRVLGDWGFGRRMSRGTGVTALFCGASGSGKTLAAEILAAELGVDLFRVDLAGIVSKYIGETEKNLDRIFAAAEHANGVVLFDESDALFGKRSEVNDSHDRYANIEISYLLQKMEQFEGVAILTTNLRGNLDNAFVRRLAFSVLFPFPDSEHRRRIWSGIWPAAVPLAPDIDFDAVADRFKLSGGNIANIALAAAFRAAARGTPIEMTDLLHATRREYQKLGKELSPAELDLKGANDTSQMPA
jgi:AAA+ superfamily predicted ATPase